MSLSNLIRNIVGNYRYVAHANRLAMPRLKREEAIIARFIKQQGALYAAPRPWSTLDLGCGWQPVNPFGADLVQGVDIRDDVESGVLKANLSFDPIPVTIPVLTS